MAAAGDRGRRAATALDVRTLLRAAQCGQPPEWPPTLVQQLLNAVRRRTPCLDSASLLGGTAPNRPACAGALGNWQIVEGEYRRDAAYTIRNQAALSLTVQLVKYLPQSMVRP